jgi:hypothetical protein
MNRSTLQQHPAWENVAQPYLPSGHPYHPLHVVKPQFGSGEIMAGAMSAKSTVEDLITFYKAFMDAFEDQTTRHSYLHLEIHLHLPQNSLSHWLHSPRLREICQIAPRLLPGKSNPTCTMSHVITPNAGFRDALLVGNGVSLTPLKSLTV